MTTTTIDDLRAFHAFVGRLLPQNGEVTPPTPEECLELWYLENRTPEEYAADVQAIREGLEDMYAGRTVPFEEFDRDFRERHGLPRRS